MIRLRRKRRKEMFVVNQIMRQSLRAILLPTFAVSLYAQAPATVPAGLPDWAFNVPDKVQPASVRPEGIVRAQDSRKEYDAAKIAGNANPPDWFPEEHEPAPSSVRGGPGINMACGSCHLMSGQGHSESADLAGMPAEYLIRQMVYYKAGTRKDDARMGPIAKAISDEDVRQAAEYFAAQKPRTFVKVIESANPPRTFIATAADIASFIRMEVPNRSGGASSRFL